jgi:AcrR family transcriptional regulator
MPKIVDHEEQRRAIAAQAAEWVAHRGIESLSLRNIADAYGCSKGMVQHYFTDKEELLFGALLFVTNQYMAREHAAVEGYRGLERVERRFNVILPLTAVLRDEWVVRLAFYARAALVPKMQMYLRDHVSAALRSGVAELREAQRAAEIRANVNLVRAYRSVMATVAGIGVSEVVSPNVLSAATQRRMLKDVLVVLQP